MLDSQISCIGGSQPDAQHTDNSWHHSHNQLSHNIHRLSPSLEPRTAANYFPAREMKFLLDLQQAVDLEHFLFPRMSLDSFADPSNRNGYDLTTLYCDTPEHDVYHRRGRHRLFKFRVRRYGQAGCIYLERKAKQGLVVRKRRVSIGMEDLSCLTETHQTRDWAGQWFHGHVLRNGLQPVCVVHYHRAAYVASGDYGALRVTFDRDINGNSVQAWSLQNAAETQTVLSQHVVCEMKYRGSLPAQFKDVIADLQLVPVGVSKFRHVFEATHPRK